MQLNSRSRSVSNRGLLALASVIIALLAMVPFGPTASAQDSAGQLDQLKSKNRDLDNKIAAEDKNITDADAAIVSIARGVQKATVELDLLADKYARVVDGRREPARTRVAFAIDAYVRGDPLLASVLEDLLNATSQIEDIAQREMYRAVVADAE